MKIETKFELEQKLWAIVNDKAQEVCIKSVDITKSGIMYWVDYETQLNAAANYKEEKQLFLSKEELIKSLD